MDNGLTLIAYHIVKNPLQLRVGSAQREWMANTRNQFAYRCLPLLMANQFGWEVLSPVSFSAKWDGGETPGSLRIAFASRHSPLILSHFGYGILTIVPGYLFETSADQNLLVRGPSNYPKHGAAPLEGLVETDWCPYTFTINWKLTRPNVRVHFAEGEPIANLIPYPRHYIERFAPSIRPLASKDSLHCEYSRWKEVRQAFLQSISPDDFDSAFLDWEKSYMQGKSVDGGVFPAHQTRLTLNPFQTDD